MSVFTITNITIASNLITVAVDTDNTGIDPSVFTDIGGYEVAATISRNGTLVRSSTSNGFVDSATPTIQHSTVLIPITAGQLDYGTLYDVKVYDDTGAIPDITTQQVKTMAQIINGGNQYKYIGHFTEPGSDALPFDVTGSAGTQAEALAEFNAKLATINLSCTLVSVSAVAPPSSADNTAIAAVSRPASGPYQTMKLSVTNTINGFKSTKVINVTNASKGFGVGGGKVDGNNSVIAALITAYRDGNNNGGYSFKTGVYTHR